MNRATYYTFMSRLYAVLSYVVPTIVGIIILAMLVGAVYAMGNALSIVSHQIEQEGLKSIFNAIWHGQGG